jgi:demethylmenaquinone methyltransferase/2-methoxy-6-polyprenyl-1,4-benzoquinol methylase
MFTFSPESEYDAVFCGFIWSHVLLQELDKFLFKAKSFLKPGGMIVFIDGNPVKGTSHDLKHLTKTDDHGNTFQTRTLEDGSIHLVLKNFPSEDFLRQRLSKVAADISVTKLEYYWIAIAGGNEN